MFRSRLHRRHCTPRTLLGHPLPPGLPNASDSRNRDCWQPRVVHFGQRSLRVANGSAPACGVIVPRLRIHRLRWQNKRLSPLSGQTLLGNHHRGSQIIYWLEGRGDVLPLRIPQNLHGRLARRKHGFVDLQHRTHLELMEDCAESLPQGPLADAFLPGGRKLGTTKLLGLVNQESEQHQHGQHHRQVLVPMAIVVLEVVSLVLRSASRAANISGISGRGKGQINGRSRRVRDPGA